MLEVRRGTSVLLQLQQPGVEIPDPLHAVIRWRLLFPLVGHVLHLSPGIFFALAHLGCVLVLGCAISLLRAAGAGWGASALAALVMGAAEWFFASTGWLGYFDAWVVLGLLLVAFARRPWVVWLACLLTPWVDERFVLGLPLALACRFALPAEAPRWGRDALVAMALALFFVVIRLGVLGARSSGGATVQGYFANLHVLEAPVSRILLGLWEGLRAGWFFAGAAVFLLANRARRAALLLGLAVVASAGVGLATAQDFGRSMLLLAPAALLGLRLAGETPGPGLRRALPIAVAATLLLPAHHVMSDRVNPIFYLYHELAAFENPPRAVMPELQELRAIQALERGDPVEALEALSLAIRLAPNPARACRQRGILFAQQQRWREARQDFSVMVEHDAQNPEGWFLRAQAAHALGDLAAAGADLQQALRLAPAGWTDRPDVARFLAKMRAAR